LKGIPVRFHPAARRELRRAVEFYDDRASQLGNDLLGEVMRVVQEIGEHPGAGSQHVADTRRLVTRRFPFSVVYSIRGEQIVIVAVAHHSRAPGYWSGRAG
jgi:toxin ParE1/3/4